MTAATEFLSATLYSRPSAREGIFNEYGYIPTGIGCNNVLSGIAWDEFSDNGGYAHLISAAAQWIMYLEGKRDWERW